MMRSNQSFILTSKAEQDGVQVVRWVGDGKAEGFEGGGDPHCWQALLVAVTRLAAGSGAPCCWQPLAASP